MRKPIATTLLSLTLGMLMMPSYAQTADEINSLLKKSKLVDTGRQVNTKVDATQTTITTFCHPKASNQDCKITALLMMKELRQHYKNILHIQVLFYDSGNSSRFRAVEIREGDVALVDSGKPLNEILARISVTDHHDAPAKTASSHLPGTSKMVSQDKSVQAAHAPGESQSDGSISGNATAARKVGSPRYEIVDGPLAAERRAFYNKLLDAKRYGFGVSAYLTAFDGIEQSVKAGISEDDLSEKLEPLTRGLTDQIKRSKILKVQKPAPPIAASEPSSPSSPSSPASSELQQAIGGLKNSVDKLGANKQSQQSQRDKTRQFIDTLKDSKEILNEGTEILKKFTGN